MKAKDLIKNLNKIIKDHGNLDLCYSIDDEGNDFKKIHWEPTVGHYDEDDREFDAENESKNYICVN